MAVNDALGAAMSGMDWMAPDINRTKGFVIDVNNHADHIIHLRASYGKSPETHRWLPYGPPPQSTDTRKHERLEAWRRVVPCYFTRPGEGSSSRTKIRHCKCSVRRGKKKKRDGT